MHKADELFEDSDENVDDTDSISFYSDDMEIEPSEVLMNIDRVDALRGSSSHRKLIFNPTFGCELWTA